MHGLGPLITALKSARRAIEEGTVTDLYAALGTALSTAGRLYATPAAVDSRGRPRADPAGGECYLYALGVWDLVAAMPPQSGLGGVPFDPTWIQGMLTHIMGLLNRAAPVLVV